MLKGYNLVGQTESAEGDQYLKVFSAASQYDLLEKFAVAAAFLPNALKNENLLHIMRKVNGVYTKESI